MEYTSVGKRVDRIDAVDKVSGQALYGDDLSFANVLYGKALRSPHAHAKIVSIDVSRAEKLPGVRAVVTGKDINAIGGEALKDYCFLAGEKVRYVGEPVAAVAAINEETAERALDLIEVTYEGLPVVLDLLEAMKKDAPLIHEKLSTYSHFPVIKPVKDTNICHQVEYVKGDLEKGFAESDIIFEDTFTTQMVQHAAIEPHVGVARVDISGNITVWVANDGPHRLRKDLADALRIPLKKVRVIVPPYMGGGFGSKGGLKVETIAITLAMKTAGQSVKMVLTREEVFTSSLIKHPTVITHKTGVKKNGKIMARYAKVMYDTGAYAEKGPTVCEQACVAALGPYNIPNVRVDGYCVYTNKAVAGAFRGYGHPQIAWAHESQMDIIAHKLGIDPVAIRLLNGVEEGDISPTGDQILHSVGLKECIRKVLKDVDWEKKFDRKPAKSYRGKGIACGFKNTKTPSGSTAIIKVSLDGSIELNTSAVEIGQGVKTILAQIAAEELGVAIGTISVATPDTEVSPYDASTTSSRCTFHMGNAVRNAAKDVRDQVIRNASEALGVDPQDLTIEKGVVYSVKDNNAKITLPNVLKNECQAGIDLIGRGSYHPADPVCGGPWSLPSIFWMFGAHYVEVDVDVETGVIKVLKVIGAHDVGKAINPVTCEGQIDGGIMQGLGPALFENMLVGENGRVLNPSFLDYKIPTALDIPDVQPIIVEATHKDGPFGAKGIGEMTTVPIAPAIANAIHDAVGVRIKDLPITPEKLLRAIKENGKQHKDSAQR